MGNSSDKAYLSRDVFEGCGSKIKCSNQLDTNVFFIDFKMLKEAIKIIHQGDPIACKNCKAILNKHSFINQQAQLEKKGSNGVQIPLEQTLWQCEFCSFQNFIQIEKEEIPSDEDVIYLISSAQQIKNQHQNLSLEQSIIFCIDTSGSMSSTEEVKGEKNLKHGMSQEEYEMLKQFMEPGDEQQINQNTTFVSRKQCVLAAIETQINDLINTRPNQFVGLVTFNSEVVIIGDGSQNPVIIAGDKLFMEDDIKLISQQAANQLMKQTISNSANQLLQKFASIKESGQTALGPALLSAVTIASQGKPGSKVIICTDGLANKGLGSIDEDPDLANQFYQNVGEFAKNNGITISIVTIKGEGCRMDILCKLAEQTHGNVARVDPQDIEKDFANILKDEVVGTNVQLSIQFHKALKFRNENDGLNVDGDLLFRNLGNVTIKSSLSFEYQVKNKSELNLQQFDLNKLKRIPFQGRIEYTNMKGERLLRVITKTIETTFDLKDAEKSANLQVIQKRVQQETAKLARKGKLSEANQFNSAWDTYLEKNEVILANKSNTDVIAQLKQKNVQLQTIIEQKQQREHDQQQQFQQKKQGNEVEDMEEADLYDCEFN